MLANKILRTCPRCNQRLYHFLVDNSKKAACANCGHRCPIKLKAGERWRTDLQKRMEKYVDIASSYANWIEYFDTFATMTEAQFDAMPMEQRLKLLTDAYGEEKPTGFLM